jgi:RimJ/RimL family protein N-acetyltransferase
VQRLTIGPVTCGDEAAIRTLLWQPEVRRFLTDDLPMPVEAIRALLAECLDPSSATDFWRIETEGGDVAGLIGLRPPSLELNRLRAIGWRSREVVVALDPLHWGRGLAAAAIEKVAMHAGGDGVTFALVAGVDAGNVRSHRLMQRCGFQELGRFAGRLGEVLAYERTV